MPDETDYTHTHHHRDWTPTPPQNIYIVEQPRNRRHYSRWKPVLIAGAIIVGVIGLFYGLSKTGK